MTTTPHSSAEIYRTPNTEYLNRVLGLDHELSAQSQGIHEAIAYFLDEVAFPCVLAGRTYGGVLYPRNIALTMSQNLFASSVWDNNWTKNQPITVAVMPDGTVTDFTVNEGSEAASVLRLVVSSPVESCALDCAWMLHELFRRRPVFHREITAGRGTASERSKVDIEVRDIRPLDEPQIADRDGSRVRVTFRIQGKHHRK